MDGYQLEKIQTRYRINVRVVPGQYHKYLSV